MAYSRPSVPKKSRTKIQLKATPSVRTKKKSSKTKTTEAFCHKVKHIVLKYSLQLYQEKFLNKPIDLKYYVDPSVEVDLKYVFEQYVNCIL